ncbi:hypothetical protein CMV_013954 [Castanea mollissima]|uniref:Uncharacterized protein n=1 Tax=Castanea mollissima TaxID=60419 RepID=A0A8J4VLD7_9ROSI|nr:hypothetical protein CMV_013954 [Castanea mollissima]
MLYHVNPQDDDEGMEFINALNLLHLDVAACQLKLGECRNSIDTCNKMQTLRIRSSRKLRGRIGNNLKDYLTKN